jgi:nicotinate-nucleotide adenylyltransferase
MAQSVRKSFPPVPNLLGGRTLKRRIGILGGSFNPAHEGHRHISLVALKTLKLDEVWWLVSPQNPLKEHAPATLEKRLMHANTLKKHPRIQVVAFEESLKTTYTYQTLRYIRKMSPNTQFVWLMGMDNLNTVHFWQHWQALFTENFIAILARKGYSNLVGCKANIRFKRSRRCHREASILTQQQEPAWVIIPCKRHPASSTAIRATKKTEGAWY